jgi:hypothetical protein
MSTRLSSAPSAAWWRPSLPAIAAAALAACSSGSSAPPPSPTFRAGAATLLSTGSPTRDEDPSVLLARDGSICVAWFSDRDGGNQEIYLARTADGVTWSGPIRITNDPGGDFYPNLIQDDAGAFHLVWFRWTALYVGRIVSRSATGDCTRLAAGADVPVTQQAGVDDWVPSLAQAADGTLLAYFVSAKRNPPAARNRIYVATRRPTDTAWNAALPVGGIDSATAQDHLPFAARTGADVTLVWVRYDGTSLTPWVAPLPKSDLWIARSTDGVTFTGAQQVTNEPAPVVHLFPHLTQRFDASWWIVWLSTRLDPVTPVPALFELPLAALAPANAYPLGIEATTQLTAGTPGYSHRIARTPAPGLYLGAWVHGAEPVQEIYYRVFGR